MVCRSRTAPTAVWVLLRTREEMEAGGQQLVIMAAQEQQSVWIPGIFPSTSKGAEWKGS